jgi:hypothetical protein
VGHGGGCTKYVGFREPGDEDYSLEKDKSGQGALKNGGRRRWSGQPLREERNNQRSVCGRDECC